MSHNMIFVGKTAQCIEGYCKAAASEHGLGRSTTHNRGCARRRCKVHG